MVGKKQTVTVERENKTYRLQMQTNISSHIFTVSATLIGVCLTVIGLIHLYIKPGSQGTISDDLLTLDALLFLLACLSSYLSLRRDVSDKNYFLEKFADVVFLLGLTLMTFVCIFITYVLV